VVVGGPAVYLLAQAAVRLRVTGRISLRRIGGALACFLIAPTGAFAPALVVAGALLAVLIGVTVADQVVAARRTGGRTRARTA
jgi:low temperature requirement protein LtrA